MDLVNYGCEPPLIYKAIENNSNTLTSACEEMLEECFQLRF